MPIERVEPGKPLADLKLTHGKRAKWNKVKLTVARLLAEDKLTCVQIAKKSGASLRQVHRWKADPVFQEKIQELLEEYMLRVRRKSLSIAERRIDSYIDDWKKLEEIVQQRGDGYRRELAERLGLDPDTATDEELIRQGAEGGLFTGLIAKDYKIGKDFCEPIYKVDTGLIDARLKVRQQLATELNQWNQKEQGNNVSLAIVITNTDMNL